MNDEDAVETPTWTAQEFKDAYSDPSFNISENIMDVLTGLDALVEFQHSKLVPHENAILEEILHLERVSRNLRRRVSDLFTQQPTMDPDPKPVDVLRTECNCPLCREQRP